jgi:uncharacterized protein YchJ
MVKRENKICEEKTPLDSQLLISKYTDHFIVSSCQSWAKNLSPLSILATFQQQQQLHTATETSGFLESNVIMIFCA